MITIPFKIVPKKFLGIDIGTSSIKVIELSRWGERRKLENYGEIAASTIYKKPFRTFEKSTLLLSNQNISRAIKAIIEETKTKTRQVIFSIPDFSSFFTNFELPAMTKEELSKAVVYEARRHVPLPLGEITLDWQVIKGQVSNQKKTKLKILLVAVPNEVINQYQEIAAISGLELFALEAEVFGLLRSLVREQTKPIVLVDLGAQSTTCSTIDKRVLRTSYSFDLSGNELIELVSKSLSIDYKSAEDLIRKYGILTDQKFDLGGEKNIREILLPLIDIILREIKRVSRNFYQAEKREIQKVIIAGGTALIPGLKEYFQDSLKKETEIANPFSNIFYPPILEKTLKEMSPSYAIAVGMALRGFE